MSDDPPRRPRGRPRAAEPRVSVASWLPVSQYDQLCRLAAHREESLSKTVQAIVVFQLTHMKPPR